MPADEDNYPSPLVSRPRSAGASGASWRWPSLSSSPPLPIATLGDPIPPDLVLIVVGLLAVIGVFCAVRAGGRPVTASRRARMSARWRRAVVDSLPFGAVVTDRDGKISYVNAQYGEFSGGVVDGVPVARAAAVRRDSPRPARQCTGCRARRAMDAPRWKTFALIGGLGGSLGGSYQAGVVPRSGAAAAGRSRGGNLPLVLWTRRGDHARPRAAGQCVPRAAARHRLSRPRAGRVPSRPIRRAGCSISTRRWRTGWATTSPSSKPRRMPPQRHRARRWCEAC